MMSVSLSEKYDDVVESVSVWYGFFREAQVEPGQAASRVLNQLWGVFEQNKDLLLIAYLILLEEVLQERVPDEGVILYLFENMVEDFHKEKLSFTIKFISNRITNEQRADLIQHLDSIHHALLTVTSPSVASLSEQLVLVG